MDQTTDSADKSGCYIMLAFIAAMIVLGVLAKVLGWVGDDKDDDAPRVGVHSIWTPIS